MCGLAGQVGRSDNEPNLVTVKKMTDSIAHRGPDGEGHWIDKDRSIALGHRRLSIIDLSSAGCQPMRYDDRYTIVFNGEIYNHIELRSQLSSKGYTFRSQSDTEVLIAMFDDQREKCLNFLDGMFAFAIYDEKLKSLFVARDRFGEKPLFYAEHDGFLYFASEIKALWAAGVPRTPDPETVFYFIQYGRVHHPFDGQRTFFTGISKLKPSHYFEISINQNQPVAQKAYWHLAEKSLPHERFNEDDVKEKFFELFKGSVSRRLRSDVPVGSSLSGGLDSSAVVCMINYLGKNQGIHQNTFSARFPGFVKDEGQYMDLVIDSVDARSFFIFPDKSGFIDNFDKLCYHQDEPFGSASIYAQFEVMKLATEHNVTVLLDGQGADEMLAGYSFYQDTFEKEQQEVAVGSKLTARQKAVNGIKKLFPATYSVYHERQLRRALFRNLQTKGYTSDYIETVRNLKVPEEIHQNLHSHLCHDLRDGNLEDLLRYADRNSMAHSREVRLPFLDKEFVEFVMSLPSDYKIRNGWSKWIQRVSFESIVPPAITWRKDKIGYEPPQKEWMSDPKFVERIRESRQKLQQNGIITAEETNREVIGSDANQIEDNSWQQLMVAQLY